MPSSRWARYGDAQLAPPPRGHGGDALLTVDDAEIPGGANISLVAHLSADGKPVLTPCVNADVVLAGTQTRVLGPADLELGEGTATIVYAIGSAEDKTLGIVAPSVDGPFETGSRHYRDNVVVTAVPLDG